MKEKVCKSFRARWPNCALNIVSKFVDFWAFLQWFPFSTWFSEKLLVVMSPFYSSWNINNNKFICQLNYRLAIGNKLFFLYINLLVLIPNKTGQTPWREYSFNLPSSWVLNQKRTDPISGYTTRPIFGNTTPPPSTFDS